MNSRVGRQMDQSVNGLREGPHSCSQKVGCNYVHTDIVSYAVEGISLAYGATFTDWADI